MNKRYLNKTRKTDLNDRFAFIVDERGRKSVFLDGTRLKFVSDIDLKGNGALEHTSVEIKLLV
ncbi:hypothetical protein FQR52_13250 [Listeria monocytogenes]|nr:hypothetical protein [Listeria monocytogenes]